MLFRSRKGEEGSPISSVLVIIVLLALLFVGIALSQGWFSKALDLFKNLFTTLFRMF
ncbi:MAG: hypothetical protein QF915_03205 [Candidatus Woesearchaeota archaeon]|jgi:hypothetical protein|nr:hypothetical protein [Candidatus Woesearchaeota archaeon]